MRYREIVGEARLTRAEKFIKDVKSDSRASQCEIEETNKNTVALIWLEGNGERGLVPWLTSVADKYGVKLHLMVDVYGPEDVPLINYYKKNGFVSNPEDEAEMKNLKDSNRQLQVQVLMDRLPQKQKVTEAKKVEASISDMEDVAQNFIASIDENIANEKYFDTYGEYIHFFIGGYQADGFTKAYAKAQAKRLSNIIRPLGWFVSKLSFDYHQSDIEDEYEDQEPQLMVFIDIFPLLGREISVPPIVYHIAKTSNLESIKQHGLLPSKGGSDFIKTKNPRVYVCLNKNDLATVIKDMDKWRGKDDLSIISISTKGLSNKFYNDVEMTEAAWTPTTIPASAIIKIAKVRSTS